MPPQQVVNGDQGSVYPPIGDYGAIGDCRTLALVSRSASIDWWCQPRFDSPALFARLIDRQRGGGLWIEADGLRPAARRYLGATAVLETRLEAEGGALTVTDFLALVGEVAPGSTPGPYARQKLVRLVRVDRGSLDLRVRCQPRPDFGRRPAGLRSVDAGEQPRVLDVEDSEGHDVLLRSTRPWSHVTGDEAAIEATMASGDELGMVLDYGPGDRAGESVGDRPVERGRPRPIGIGELHTWLDETCRFWEDWAAAADYHGPYRDLVTRSAVTLKLLTYHPTGAVVAAGTTSLPEEIGGARNWDYRFTWLRDATFVLYALHTLGYRRESDGFMDWLSRATIDSRQPLVLYRVDGVAPPTEEVLTHLEGYRGSSPVRVGNGAARQRQLDVYGEILDAAYLDVKAGNELRDDEWALLSALADAAADQWQLPDTSIWEVRGGDRHFTYSKVLCWVAMDRARRLADLTGRTEAESERLEVWSRAGEEIRSAVMEQGRREDGAFVQYFGSERIDASALVFPLVGFVSGRGPSARATLAAVRRELEHDGGLVARYRPDQEVEGVAGGEGAFLICSYWLCDNLALQGDVDEAERRFEALSTLTNDLGLFSEEWDPVERRALGNFPQAFTHIALVSTAHNLERANEGRLHTGQVRSSAPRE